jgi:hypothetical protein
MLSHRRLEGKKKNHAEAGEGLYAAASMRDKDQRALFAAEIAESAESAEGRE